MAKITGQQNRDNRCVANLPRVESSVANLPSGESSGNRGTCPLLSISGKQKGLGMQLLPISILRFWRF